MSYAYSVAALVAAHESFRDLLDASVTPGMVRIRDSGNVLLAEATLTDPAGTVDPATGTLTLSVATQETAAPASGTAATAELTSGGGSVHLTIPCVSGSSAVSGYCVLSNLSITAGSGVNVISVVIG